MPLMFDCNFNHIKRKVWQDISVLRERFTFSKLNKTMSTTQVTSVSKIEINAGEPEA